MVKTDMNPIWVITGVAAGLLAGAGLRCTVFRLSVPSGEPDRTTCPNCQRPLGTWLAVRCAGCRRSLGYPAVLELATAAVLALLLGRFGDHPYVVAFAFLGALGVALAAIDISVQRLPDRLTLPAIPVLAVLLGAAAVIDHNGTALLRALLGGLALAIGYLLLALVSRGQLGGGDVKLAALAGIALGWLGWPELIIGTALGWILAALAGLVLLALRRVTLRSHISFGPFLLGGALLSMLAAGSVLPG
jgi:leader peptidase (prepilin peptidase)/N-methyltransferase